MKVFKNKTTALITIISSVVLILAILFPIITFFVINKTPKLSIAVISDTHVLAASEIGQLSDDFVSYSSRGQKMLHISEAIYKTAIDNLIDDKSDILLVAGDLTDDGGKTSHQLVAQQLKRYEQSGKKAYVIPGNHDILNKSSTYINGSAEITENVSPEDFEEIYADFGYNEATNRHDDSLSYTIDLDKKHKLIAIDCSFYEENEQGYVTDRHSPNMTESLLEWAESQIKEAVKNKQTPIGMMHFPLLPHHGQFVEKVMKLSDNKVNDHIKVADTLINAGLNIVFTGHLHSQDTTSYTKDDKTIYDIETAALTNYPVPIRYFNVYNKKYDISTTNLNKINKEYIPSFVSEEEKTVLLNDFSGYAANYVNQSMKNKILNKIDSKLILKIMSKLNIDSTTEQAIALADDILDNMILEFLDLPLYNKDDNQLSVEKICTDYQITLPQTEYNTVWELFMRLLKNNYNGDENLSIASSESKLLKYSVYSVFYFIADYDLFGKLGDLQPSLGEINLMNDMETLFTEDRLPLVSNNLLSTIISALGININPNLSSFSYVLDDVILPGYDLSIYIDQENESLLLGYLIEDFLIDKISEDLLTDGDPSDNNFQINRKTMTVI